MFRIVFLLFISIPFIGCHGTQNEKECFRSGKTSTEFIEDIIRYVAALPGKATHETKFNPVFNDYYRSQVQSHTFMQCAEITDTIFFLLRRQAPSLTEKYVAIGGKVLYNEMDSIVYYAEVFRTWKMPAKILEEKAQLLFDKMKSQSSLREYLPQCSGQEEWVEFPDAFTQFDTKSRQWISQREDPMEPYYLLKTATN